MPKVFDIFGIIGNCNLRFGGGCPFMAIVHFSKVNVNADIYKVYSKEMSIEEIMFDLFGKINDEIEYKLVEERNIRNEEGEYDVVKFEETFNFSKLKRVNEANELYITGKLVRRYPLHSEEWDDGNRESHSVTYSNNSISTFFYFDMKSEIIAFSERQKFGFKQFNKAFQELLNNHINTTGFEIFYLNDPFTIEDRLKKAYKVERIRATVIPPNNNNDSLKKLYDDEIEGMEEANVQKKTSVLEVHKKSEKGINIESQLVRSIVNSNTAYDRFAHGYGSIEIDGENKDGTKFHFDSEKDSPYQVTIKESQKNDPESFIKRAKSAISAFLAKESIKKYTDR